MNTKSKLISVLVLASAGLALAACGSSTTTTPATTASVDPTITRAQALTVLDGMKATVTATTYKAPTSVKIVTANSSTKAQSLINEADGTAVYAHTTYVTATTKNSVDLTANTEIFAYKDGDNYVVAEKTGDTLVTGYSSTTDFGVAAAVAKKLSLGSAASMAKFIRNFADGKTGLVTGATVRAGTVMAAESYKSTGADNVILDITPNYTGEGDEHMVYTYADNKLQSNTNDLHASVVNYTWGATVTATKQTGTLSGIADETAAKAVLALL